MLLTLVGASAGQDIRFEDVSERAGVAQTGKARAAAVHDFDGDGWADIFVSIFGGVPVLYHNNRDGTFTNIAESAGLTEYAGHTSAVWGDVNDDGLVDLFVGRTLAGQNRLLLNRGDLTFEDVTDVSGIAADANIATAAFGDFDGDGAVDLFLAVDRAADLLYRNTNGGSAIFEDVSEQAGIAGPAPSVPMQGTWVDYDRDGDLDLFCVHDSRTPSRLYRNSGYLPFSNIAAGARIDTYPTDSVCCNMGTAWGDYNGDGWLDAYVTRIGTGGLYRNNGDGTFDDVAIEVGADRNGMSWGVVFSDFDNDADEDLFIVSTSGYDGTPVLLYRNDGGTFTEIGSAAGVSYLMEAQGLAAGDFNNDGLVDLFIPSHDGNSRLLENVSENTGRWVEVSLTGASANTAAIGTRVELHVGDKMLVRVVSGGDSFGSQSSPRLHFGLGHATRIDTLRILWSGSAAEEFTGLDVDREYLFEEGRSTARAPTAPHSEGEVTLINYPNPFGSGTSLRYSVPVQGRARVEIVDLLGRTVSLLADGFHWPGMHELSWSAAGLPSGVYFCRVTTSEGRAVRRMVVTNR